MHDEFLRLDRESVDFNGRPVQVDRRPYTVAMVTGNFEDADRFVVEFMDRIVALYNDCILELDAVGVESILDPQRLKNDLSLVESKVLIKQSKAVSSKYEAKFIELIEDTRTRVYGLSVAPVDRDALLAGLDSGMNKLAVLFQLGNQITCQVENAIDLLANARLHRDWNVEGDLIVFTKDNDLKKFNSYVAEIQRLRQQIKQMQNDSRANFDHELDVAKQLL